MITSIDGIIGLRLKDKNPPWRDRVVWIPQESDRLWDMQRTEGEHVFREVNWGESWIENIDELRQAIKTRIEKGEKPNE